ncbi:hypothetical protein K438DRAFT_1784160 [Mycena galopus ATCC 62051]|nr:hypothetical protein K438DRAFT_1784160 [Mycena galopus ATCC 62051]
MHHWKNHWWPLMDIVSHDLPVDSSAVHWHPLQETTGEEQQCFKSTYGSELMVQVNFFNKHDHSAALCSVFVEDYPVRLFSANDSKKTYTTRLTKLIPAAIKNDSPVKEWDGHLYRPNVRNDPGHHYMGGIDTILMSNSTALSPLLMNEYTLCRLGDSVLPVFHFDLSLQSNTDTNINAKSKDGKPVGHKVRCHNISGSDNDKSKSLQFTGEGTDVPLPIASNCISCNLTHPKAAPGLKESQLLDRKLKQEKVFGFLSGWGRTQGGYTVSKQYKEFPATQFDNKFVYECFKQGSLSTSNIDKWFSPEKLEHALKVQEVSQDSTRSEFRNYSQGTGKVLGSHKVVQGPKTPGVRV